MSLFTYYICELSYRIMNVQTDTEFMYITCICGACLGSPQLYSCDYWIVFVSEQQLIIVILCTYVGTL